MREWAWQQISLSGPQFWTRLVPEEILQLQRLASGQRVLEIGGGYGYSACGMALGGAKHVLSVDPHEPHKDNDMARYGDTFEEMTNAVQAYGLQNKITIDRRASAEALTDGAVRALRFGLILVDGDMDEQHVSGDIQAAVPLLGNGGHLVVTNYGDTDYGSGQAIGFLFDGGLGGYTASEVSVPVQPPANLIVLSGIRPPT